MTLLQALKTSDTLVGSYKDFRKIKRHLKRNRSAVEHYLQSHSIKKLQLGSGFNHISGWLGTDIAPTSNDVAFLDATKPFPMADQTFDYVFSEHMIEHISWQDGLQMLKQCLRVLKPGGILRLSTPDLAVLLGLYQKNREAMADRYIEWITDQFLPDIDVYKAPFVINNAFRNFGHQFLYDGDVLNMAMSKAGFINITRCVPSQSTHEELRGIEAHGARIDDQDINNFESMVFEGMRPS